MFTIDNLKLLILMFYLLIVLFIILISWLYLTRTVRASKSIGLHAPEYIKVMARVSIANGLFTAVLISIFLLTKFY